MNMFVSSAAVAAASPAAAEMRFATKDEAALARIEQVVDYLRTRYVREGWKIDESEAALALDYYRRRAHGPAFKDEDADTTAFYRAIEFFRSHGQSLDWVHDGNPVGLICDAARHSKRGNGLAELARVGKPEPILELIERHKAMIGTLEQLCREDGALRKEIGHHAAADGDRRG
ncbi:hypothetical protein IF803_23225 [Bradyrhizobium sp. UFLA06-06]